MRVLLYQLDGKLPNIALMRVGAHHRALGDEVELRRTNRPEKQLWDDPDRVYASAIFQSSRPALDLLRRNFPDAIVGGTGSGDTVTLESLGITTLEQDYSIYPGFRQSIGFSQRGCRLRCSFCVVPTKEGAMRGEQSIARIWRGEPWPRELLLLDNDFFGQPEWQQRIEEIRAGRFRVSFTQGVNVRFITRESAEALASVNYRDDSMGRRRIYTAWDNFRDKERLFSGLKELTTLDVHPDHIMVYMQVGYDHAKRQSFEPLTPEDLGRPRELRAFGARPYPMPYIRTPELVGFQRWIVGR